MQVNYIDGNEVKIQQHDRIFVDLEFFNGIKETGLEPHRLFPTSGLLKYISLLDEDGNVKYIIHDVERLLPESKDAMLAALNEYYMIPKIKRLIKRTEKFLIWMWTVETDKGITTFEIINSYTAIKVLYDGRILIKDSNDNRYEIPDLNKLDKHSIKLILPDV